MNNKIIDNFCKNYFFLFTFFFLLIRFILIKLNFDEGTDFFKYFNVAININNGCGVSNSILEIEDCKKDFGPVSPPLYSIYLYIIKFVINFSLDKIIWVNLFLSYLANLYLLKIIKKFYSNKIFFVLSILLIFDPLNIGWSRFLISENFHNSIFLIFISLIITLMNKNKINFYLLGLILFLLTFTRLESFIFLFYLIPIFYSLKKEKYKIFISFVVFILLWSTWTIRNLYFETEIIFPLKNLSKFIKYEKGHIYPSNFHDWSSTWVNNEYYRSNVLHNIQFDYQKKNPKQYNYENIYVPENIYFNYVEKNKTKKLLNELKKYSGKPFSRDIDMQFKDLYEERKKNIYNTIKVNFQRSLFLLLNPVSSYGLPLEFKIENLNKFSNNDLTYYKNLILNNKKIIFGKIFLNLYKLSLVISFSIIVFILIIKKKTKYIFCSFFEWTFIIFILKIFILSFLNLLETRYVATNYISLQIFLIIFILEKKLYVFLNYKKCSFNRK
jgi:hypothetical protein